MIDISPETKMIIYWIILGVSTFVGIFVGILNRKAFNL
jgi:hypothetical protein